MRRSVADIEDLDEGRGDPRVVASEVVAAGERHGLTDPCRNWWEFEFKGEASRFLRASGGAAVALGVFGLGRLLRPAPHEVETPSDADLARAARIIEGQAFTLAYLVFLRDKGLMFDEAGEGFLMYGVQGRTWGARSCPSTSCGTASRRRRA